MAGTAVSLLDRIVRAFWARDRASQALGMRVVSVAPGSAAVMMRVRPEMLNGHGTCHGGFIFALADTAFGFACNSHNENTVAAGASIAFLAPANENDELTAAAVEQARTGRTGVYDVVVTDQAGRRIALFRGNSHRIKGEIVPTTGDAP